jgi:hypothetical protein
MGQPETQTRKFTVYLTREQAQMIDQERLRLRQEYGVKLSGNEIIQVLIEMHRLRLQVVASEESDARWWMHQMLADQDEDEEGTDQ